MNEREVFLEALELATPAERAAYLQAACGPDAPLRGKVEELLKEHFSNDSLIAGPALAGGAPTVPGLPTLEATAQMIGRYKLLEMIGEGGFGEVWMAEQREPVKRRVALKLIKPGMDSRQIVARFEAERQALAMMDHTNIAKIFDAGTTEAGRPYFVMELVRGVKITDYCDQNQLNTGQRLDLFIRVCNAIQHAHQKGIIHRDIKPSNVLVTVNDGLPVPKVIDFGIAKATQAELTDKTVFTQFQQFIGTPAYISPEQAEMSSLDIDTRADIYSLGVLLYELLVGQTPFDAREMMQGGLDALRRIIREQEPQRPSTKLSTLPGDAKTTAGKRRQTDTGKLVHQLQGDLDWIVMKCLEKDRTRRYETANGLAADLNRHLNNEPVVARPPSAVYRLQKTLQRHRLAFTAAAAVMVALLVGTTVSLWQAVQATQARDAESRQRVAADGAREEAVKAKAQAQQKQREADQERQRAERFVKEVDDANVRLKRAATRAEFTTGSHFLDANDFPKGIAHLARALRTDPSFWPAATRLVSTLTDRGFALDDLPLITHDLPIYDHVVDLATGLLATRGEKYDLRIWNAWTAELLMTVPAIGNRKMPSLSSDGRRVMFVDTNGIAPVFEPFTRPDQPLAVLKADTSFTEAVFSPAPGPILIAATRLANGAVQMWNAETGSALTGPMPGTSGDGGFLAFTGDGRWLVGSFADGRVMVWPAPSNRGKVGLLAVDKGAHLTLAPDSKTLVERRFDGLGLRFWDLESGQARVDAIRLDQPLARIPGEPGTVPLGTSHGHSLQFSPDGRRMVAVSHATFGPHDDRILHDTLEVHCFDVSDGKLVRTLSENLVTEHRENLVAGLSAMVIQTNRLIIRSLATGAIRMDQTWPTDQIMSVEFSPAGDRILVAFNDRRLILFDTRDGKSLTHPGDPAQLSHVGGGSGRVPGQTHFMRHGPRLGGLGFSPEGDVFFTLYENGDLQLWDAYEGLPIADPVPGQWGNVQFSKDGRKLLLSVRNGGTGGLTYFFGHLRTIGRNVSAARHRALPYQGSFPALHFSADGRYGMVGREGLVIFQPTTGVPIRRIDVTETGLIGSERGNTWLISEAWFSPSGDRIVAVCHSDTRSVVKVFETATGRTLHTLPPQEGARPIRVRFAGEGRIVVGNAVSADGVMPLQVVELATGRVLAETKPADGPNIFDVSLDGRRIASCGTGIALLDTADLKPVAPLRHHRDPAVGMYAIAFSPDSRRLVTGSMEGTIRVWKAETGELEAEFEHLPRWVGFSPDSQRVVAAGHGIYDVPSTANVWELTGAGTKRVSSPLLHPNTIVHTMFSADGRFLIAGDRSGLVVLWDLETSLPMLNQFFVEGNSGVTRVGINPQMSRVYALAGQAGRLHHRPLPPPGVVPNWFPELAEAVVRRRINDQGAMESLRETELRQVKAHVATLSAPAAGDDFYFQWARWFFGDHATRAVAPLTSFTVEDEVQELLSVGSLAALRRAHHLRPTDARVFAALARETALLEEIRGDVTLDPNSVSAAEWLARQAVAYAPNLLEAQAALAEVLLRLGKPDPARAALAAGPTLDPDNPAILAIQSELVRLDGRTNEAHTLLSRALSAPPQMARSGYLKLGSVARHPDFFAEASLRNRTEQLIAGRTLNLPIQFIDLTPWYNEPVSRHQTNSAKPVPGFGGPVLSLGGIPFDVRGLIALSTLPDTIGRHKGLLGVPIHQSCARLHFCMASWPEPTSVRLRVHYSDGQSREFPIGVARGEWQSPAAWDNPRPDVAVRTIDLIALPNSAFQLVGITAQTSFDPILTIQPKSAPVRLTMGQPLELSVAVTTPGSWSYQWSAKDQLIAGATNATLRIARMSAKDLGSYQVEVRTTQTDPASQTFRSASIWVVDPADPVLHGALKEELFLNVPGSQIGDLLKSSKFPSHPDQVRILSTLEVTQSLYDDYGRRLSGWIVPQETAEYVFYLCSDDSSRLSLSSDETPAKLNVIAQLSGWKRSRLWGQLDAESISKPLRLEAGKRYFVEVLHKDGAGDDYLGVAWRKAGDAPPSDGESPIGTEFLASSAD